MHGAGNPNEPSSGSLGLGAVPKWLGAKPRKGRNDGGAASGSNAPPEQDYGAMVTARLQPRLDDPQWQTEHAARCNNREQERARHEGPSVPAKKTINPVVPIPGCPLPPPRSYGSATMMESHYERFSAEHKIAANFNPGNNAMMIAGRPVTVLQISHEGAGIMENDGYIPWLFRPLQVVTIDGYTAGEEIAPRGPKHYCVIRWMQATVFAKSFNHSFIDESRRS